MAEPAGSYVLGSDLGTSGCKSIVMDAEGCIRGWAIQSYPTESRFPGWAEQNPQDWYEAFCSTTRQALAKAGINPAEIAVVCIVGITHNAVLLDRQARVLRPSIVYTDIRSTAQTQAILERWGDRVFAKTWNKPAPLWTWPELMWICEHEPELWKQVDRILFPKDYVRNLIAPSFLSDPIDPVGTLLFDPIQGIWISEFIETLGLSESAFPEVYPVTQIVGAVTREAAEKTGLRAGTLVATGTTDTAAEVFGVGALECGQAIIKLATVGRIMAVSDRPLPNHTFLNYPFVIPGYWYPGTSTKFAASAFNWVRRAFWSDEEVEGIYDLMDQSAGSIPPGSDGLLFHPYLAGEFAPSWDPYLRASFLGIGRDHNRSHFTRAVMEGVGLSVRDALENAIEMGLSIKDIRLIGGGSESQLWSQIMADIINQEIVVPVGNDAAFGAALLAGVAAGIFDSSPETINQLIHFRACHHPEPTSVALYDELFLIYKEAALATRQISHKLHHFQTKLHEENSRASSEIENPDTLSL